MKYRIAKRINPLNNESKFYPAPQYMEELTLMDLAKDISDAFRSVDMLIGEDIVKFPVIIDTVNFNDREAYAIAYLCEEGENLDMEAQEAMELKRFDEVLIIGVYKDSSDIFYKDKYSLK